MRSGGEFVGVRCIHVLFVYKRFCVDKRGYCYALCVGLSLRLWLGSQIETAAWIVVLHSPSRQANVMYARIF